MANLSAHESTRVITFVGSALRRVPDYRNPDGTLVLYRAARELSGRLVERRRPKAKRKNPEILAKQLRGSPDHQRVVNSNRKLLQRALNGEIRNLRDVQAIRLLELVAMIGDREDKEAGAIRDSIRASEERRLAGSARVRSGKWTYPAEGYEVLALRLASWDPEVAAKDYVAEHGVQPGPAVDAEIADRIARAKWLLVEKPISKTLLGQVTTFEERAARAGHSKPRIRYAIRRFFGPFCQWHRTRGACRGWHEMNADEQKSTFAAGLTLETAWLGKASRITPHREAEVSGSWASIGRLMAQEMDEMDGGD